MAEDKLDVVDEEDALAMKARSEGIPLDFAGAKQRMVHLPTVDEARIFSQTRIRTCGSCKHFSRKHFASKQDRWVAELVHDYEWRTRFLGDHPDNLGVCGARDHVVTGPTSLACSNFRSR